MKKNNPPDGPTYAEAYAELQKILADLQAEQIDIDALADQIGRANELIAICRERLRTAEKTLESGQ
jgi:exodeoxyribonuclease VII small subunit